MSGDLDLEQRYRRVLRLLPGYYRDTWEQDMVAAFLDSWLTGDPDEDSVTMEFDRPGWREVASVAGPDPSMCYRPLGAPVTITSAAVSAPVVSPASPPPGQPPRRPSQRGPPCTESRSPCPRPMWRR